MFKKNAFSMLLLCIVICLSFNILLFSTRTQPHVDEVWSYMLSNKTDSPFLYAYSADIGIEPEDIDGFNLTETKSYTDHFNHWHDGSYYKQALTVQPDEKFSYDRVFYNQTLDVHPPLYYFILHTICSFFPNRFSFWYAFAVNIVFYTGTLIMLYFIARKLGIKNNLAILSVLFYGLSASGTNEICFLRMYMMLSFFLLCITYFMICLILDFKMKYVIGITILNVLSFLTQYYAYVYVFFLTLFCVIYLFLKKKIKNGIIYGFFTLLSVAVAILCFPATLKHVFLGHYSGSVTYGEHKPFISALIEAFDIVDESYFGFKLHLTLLIIPICFIFIFFMFLKYQRELKLNNISSFKSIYNYISNKTIDSLFSNIVISAFFIILISVLLDTIIVIDISPNMGEFMVRYIFPVLPLFSIFAIYFFSTALNLFLRKLKNRKMYYNIIISITVSAFIITSHSFTSPSRFLQNPINNEKGYEDYFNGSNIILVNETFNSQALSPMLINASKVYPTESLDENLKKIIADVQTQETPLYLVVSESKYYLPEVASFLSENETLTYSYKENLYFSTETLNSHYIYEIKTKSISEN